MRRTTAEIVATTLFCLIFLMVTNVSLAQDGAPTVGLPKVAPAMSGNWTYRSYVSNPDPAVAPNDLLFGLAQLVLEETSDGSISGTIGGNGWSLALEGKSSYSAESVTIKFQGKGTVGTEPWVYDYFAYFAPNWSNGTEQVSALLGTVVRTAPHGGSVAGVVASFIAVKQ